MLTLHSLTEQIRTILKIVAILGGGILLIFLVFKAGGAVMNVLFPKKPPPPTVTFGKLPHVVFPQSVTNEPFSYNVDTVTGILPTFPDRVAVYSIERPIPNLLNLQKAKSKVEAVGFVKRFGQEEIIERSLTDSVYQWDEPSALKRSIVMDINSFAFTMNSQFLADENVLSARLLADEPYAIKTAEDFLTDMLLLPKDFNPEKTTTELLRIENGTVVGATSLSNAQLIRVDFHQQDIDKLPIVYPNPPHSNMNFLVGSGQNDAEVVQANFIHQTIDKDQATYPIKSAQNALEDLEQGKGYIGAYFGSTTEISIKNMKLAYFLGDKLQKYVMPVYVFEGNDGFVAYVFAITDEWIATDTAAP